MPEPWLVSWGQEPAWVEPQVSPILALWTGRMETYREQTYLEEISS